MAIQTKGTLSRAAKPCLRACPPFAQCWSLGRPVHGEPCRNSRRLRYRLRVVETRETVSTTRRPLVQPWLAGSQIDLRLTAVGRGSHAPPAYHGPNQMQESETPALLPPYPGRPPAMILSPRMRRDLTFEWIIDGAARLWTWRVRMTSRSLFRHVTVNLVT